MSKSSEFQLNAQQRAAVEHGDGPLLVVAGAGTGKTRLITERIRHLLESNPELSGENILGLTFTDKAAAVMKHRVVNAMGERAKDVTLSTFHSFCMEKILRETNPDLQVLDKPNHWILLRRHMAELGLEHYKKLSEPGQFLTPFVEFFSRCQDELVTAEDYRRYVSDMRKVFENEKKKLDADLRAVREEEIEKQEEVARAYQVSERLLRERNLVTFGGQIMHAVELLRVNRELLKRLRERYRYILVDEFQDTNIAQLELLWLLAADHRNIVAVGDDDQAIYRFRGAAAGSFVIFLERFCGVTLEKPQGRSSVVALTENYRSTSRILRVAGQVISHNEKHASLPPKQLLTTNPEGEKIRIVEFASDKEEAHWIVSEIERLHGTDATWRSFAVLYRQHTHRDELVKVLRQRHIPFVIKKLSILTSTLVRDVIAYLRLVNSTTDDVSCARVLAIPYWGLEPGDLVRLAERADRSKGQTLWDVLAMQNDEPPPPARRTGRGNKEQTAELMALITTLQQRAKNAGASEVLGDLIGELQLAPLHSDADRVYLKRFREFVDEWEKKSEGKNLRDFIEYLEYFQEAGGEISLNEEPEEDAVQLMTVHAAKGLEFPRVFVMRLTGGGFPPRPRAPILEFPPELMKEEQPKYDFHIQEERRLFYVAVTRAQRHLTLTTIVGPRKKASPFLDDILENPKIKRADACQLAPKLKLSQLEEAVGPAPADASKLQLFGPDAQAPRAYSRITLWARAFHPSQPEPLKLSASAIDTYESCPMKYQFGQTWCIAGGPQAAMTFGNVMHITIREFIGELRKKRRISMEEVLAIFDREWSEAGFRDDYQEEEYRKAGREQLKEFYRSTIASQPDVFAQEKKFDLPLEPDILITGRMDQINRLGERECEIVDYKTGNPRDEKAAQKSLQLSLYALAAKEAFELEPQQLVFYNLTTNEAVATSRDAKSLEKAQEKVAEVADRIRAGDFPATPGFICRYCDYRALCPAHEQLISIRAAEPSAHGTKKQ